MKVIFVTTNDALDIRNWSGIPYYIAKTFLDAGIEVEFISDLKSLPANNLRLGLRNFIYNKILKKKLGNYISFYEPENLKFIAKQVSKRIRNIDNGIIFSPSSIPIAYLDTDKPVVFWTDATFAVMENYYQDFNGLSNRTLKNCHSYEKNAIKRSDLAIYASEWAATSAVKDYGADPDKVKVLPFGANIECKRTEDDIISINFKKSRNTCKLLFVGKEWERKGADIAVDIASELNKSISVELTIVGCTAPSSLILPDFVKVTGFLDKAKTVDEQTLEKLYNENHFFLLPSKAEAMGVVFCEANSYGLPVITTNTGGISSVVKNEVNGKMFDLGSDTRIFAEYIKRVFADFKKYNEYSLNCFREYSTRLNWEVSVNNCISYMKNIERRNKKESDHKKNK